MRFVGFDVAKKFVMNGLSADLDGKNEKVVLIVKLKIVGSSIGNCPAEIFLSEKQ
jgi:hypothetical protein